MYLEKIMLSDGRMRNCAIMMALLFPMAVFPGNVPEYISGVSVVDSEGLIDLVVAHDDAVVIDARLQSDYIRGHIDGAVNVPNTETDCNTLSKAAPGSSSPIVFYCNGANCMRSAESIKIARACGYGRVYWFRGGFEEWLAKGYPYLKK